MTNFSTIELRHQFGKFSPRHRGDFDISREVLIELSYDNIFNQNRVFQNKSKAESRRDHGLHPIFPLRPKFYIELNPRGIAGLQNRLAHFKGQTVDIILARQLI